MRSVAEAAFVPPAFRMNLKPAMPATASRTGTVSMGPVIGVSARRAHTCCGCRQIMRRQCVIRTGGGLHAAPQPIGCGGSVRRHDGPRPRCSTAKNGSFVTRRPRRISTASSPTERPRSHRRSRGLRSEPPWSFAHYHVLMGIARAALRPEKLTSSSSAAT